MTTLSTQSATVLAPLPYARQSIDEEDIAAVVEVLRSPRITQGPKIAEFERRIAEHCGARHAVAVANGTAALHVAALASGIGPGNVGVTSTLTFLASANCIAYTGARVDLLDVSPDTLCLDIDALADRCAGGAAPKLVVAVDFAGVPCGLPALYALAERYGFALIEDASHALGSEYAWDGRNYRCGGCDHAHLATLSFHPVKTITAGEGGMVLTNDGDLADRVRRLACHGVEREPARLIREDGPWYHEMHALGYNYRITDLQAALGISQLRRLEEWCRRRREIVAAYNEAFGEDAFPELVETPPWPEGTRPAFHIYVLRLTGAWRRHRRRFFERLVAAGIHPQVHYIPVHTQPYYRARAAERPVDLSGGGGSSPPLGPDKDRCLHLPVAEDTYERCVSLPLYPSMTDGDVSRVIETVGGILSDGP